MSKKKKILITILSLILLIHILPFLIPLSTASRNKPDTEFLNSHWVTVDDLDLHYRTWFPENPQHDPIVYVHGLGGSTFSWRYNITAFIEEGYPIIAVDLPAFGYSSRKAGLVHSQENRSEWVFEVLESLHSNENLTDVEGYHLVGHSMGGGVITAMALKQPEDIHTLTYVAGAVTTEPSWFQSLLAYPPIKRTVAVVGEHIFFRENRLEEMLANAYGQEAQEAELSGYFRPFKIPGTARAWSDLLTTATSFEESVIKNISIPTFLIWGDEDTWVPLKQGERLRDILPNAKLSVINGSAHTPMETHVEEFNERLLNFLSGRHGDATFVLSSLLTQ